MDGSFGRPSSCCPLQHPAVCPPCTDHVTSSPSQDTVFPLEYETNGQHSVYSKLLYIYLCLWIHVCLASVAYLRDLNVKVAWKVIVGCIRMHRDLEWHT